MMNDFETHPIGVVERLNLKLDVYKRYRVENRKLEAELKQANAELLTAQNERAWLWDRLNRLEKNDHWKTKLRVAMAEALAALETDDG